MTDEDAFLAAIDARPDDVLTRLVYADWLEERGDERATLIRVMEEMRPLAIWSDEFQRFRPDRNRLRKSLDPAWQERMGYALVHRPMFGTIPERPEHRWRLAEEFIDIWHGGLNPGDGYTEEELRRLETDVGYPLPEQLRQWYRFAGKRPDIWSEQHGFGDIPEWIRRNSRDLVFRWDAQDVQRWYIRTDDLGLQDPPVFISDDANERWQVANSVTEFALFALVYEVQYRNICCEVDVEGLGRNAPISREYLPNTLPSGFSPHFEFETREATDRFLFAEATGYVMAVCRTETAYEQLVADFGERVSRYE